MHEGDSHGGRVRQVRRVALALVAMAVAAALGALWAAGQETNVATATVLVHPLEGNAYSPGGRGDELVNLATEAEVLRSDAVARAVAARLADDSAGRGGPGRSAPDADTLLAGISVAVPPSTQLLEVTARAADGATAARWATAFAETYLEFRQSRTESDIAERSTRLQELITARGAERSTAVARLQRVGAGAPAGILPSQQVQDLTSQIGSLRAQLAAAEAVSRDPGQVVTPGTVAAPSALADPVAVAALAAGAVAALCLGIAVAGRSRRSADEVGGVEDLEDTDVALVRDVGSGLDLAELARFRAEILAFEGRPVVVAVGAVEPAPAEIHPGLVDSLTRARYDVVAIDLTDRDTVDAVVALVLEEAAPTDVLTERSPFLREVRQPAPAIPATGNAATTPSTQAASQATTQAVTQATTEVARGELADVVASSAMPRALTAVGKDADVVLVRCDGLRSPVGHALLRWADVVVIEVHPRASTRAEVEDVVRAAGLADTLVAGLAVLTPARRRGQGWARSAGRRRRPRPERDARGEDARDD